MSRRRKNLPAGGAVKAPCPACSKQQNSRIVHGLEETWNDEETGIGGTNTFYLFECLGCNTIFHGKKEIFSEDWVVVEDPLTGEEESIQPTRWSYFPELRRRTPPKWFRFAFRVKYEPLSALMLDTYDALNREKYILAAMGVRACFDIASETLEIDTTLSFGDKIESLRRKGHISPREKQVLEVLVDVGSAAAHRGWNPSFDDVDLLVDALETFIHHAIILPKGLDKLAKRVPPKRTAT